MEGKTCPYLNQECIGNKCALHTHIRGKDPQSENEIDYPGCSIAFLPALLIENSQQQRHTGVAVETMRNEVNKSNELNQESINTMKDSIEALVTAQDKTREVIKTVGENLVKSTVAQIPS